jgi:hypothetical protein
MGDAQLMLVPIASRATITKRASRWERELAKRYLMDGP